MPSPRPAWWRRRQGDGAHNRGEWVMAADEVIPTRRPADQLSPVLPAPRGLLHSAVVIVVYLLIGVVAFWPVYPVISQHLFGFGGDFTQTVWYLDWVPHALAHGLNPF